MGALTRTLRLVLVASLLVAVAPSTQVVRAGQPTLAQLIGQKLVVRMEGTTPSADLLGRIQRGEIGGVVLFGSNLTTRDGLIALTAELHAAAQAGGQPRFLIAVDQEGGSVKRIPWAPPTLSAPAMGRIGSASVAVRAPTPEPPSMPSESISTSRPSPTSPPRTGSCIATAAHGRSALSRRRSLPTHSRPASNRRVSGRR